ncbi:ChrR family anti-sigma-E factor [Bowmanella dokdonensis]|uniref:Cupin domain-containing protein n=1 Tax=Bowmanella dokdonensis TaxID=751969 RepID=A0A939IT53_9ALTE|nr:ChrR family anti-sigma-E factor [Bowmanella dokdonensis]MBN7827116.1 cupin domain-containing protein [Bowmanella dokdonensis]
MIKLHPSYAQLERYVEGSCNAGEGLIVSAHLDMCLQCRSKVTEMENSLADKMLANQVPLDPAYAEMCRKIVELPAEIGGTPALHQTLELDGRQFTLPRALRRYASQINGWSHMVGKLWQARVDLGIDGRADFIYMEKGGSVPEHTHRGSELTLVLDGEFSDGLRDYDTGDFILCDGRHTHMPHTDADEGCLVFSIVDQPLHFTSGLARLLNPFSHLFFK